MTMDKEFITTIIAIVTATVVITRKMITKEDLAKLETKVTTDITKLDVKWTVKLDKMSDRIDRMAEQHHADMMTLQRDIVGLHDRVAKVEKA